MFVTYEKERKLSCFSREIIVMQQYEHAQSPQNSNSAKFIAFDKTCTK